MFIMSPAASTVVQINSKHCVRAQVLSKQDETLVVLKEIVTQGWPEKIKDLPPELQPYWTF